MDTPDDPIVRQLLTQGRGRGPEADRGPPTGAPVGMARPGPSWWGPVVAGHPAADPRVRRVPVRLVHELAGIQTVPGRAVLRAGAGSSGPAGAGGRSGQPSAHPGRRHPGDRLPEADSVQPDGVDRGDPERRDRTAAVARPPA